ncbi:MAG: HisA/HisF-related TIM barrel protein, partial [Pseudomonadota bacterium]|nr:HisA/HisF-related TIM barrel protein [Pseudomonadota bacterium]
PGINTRTRYHQWRQLALGSTVLGSETLSNTGLLQNTRAADTDTVLSLDFNGDRLLGPPDLLEQAEHWPTRVIVMCLDRVGSDEGPDTERMQQLRRKSPASELFAAGGVRDLDDLLHLRQLGVAGALLASALHDGRIGPAQIAALA